MGMAHEDGTILASELYPVAEACGQTPDQIRSCLRRLVTEGLFEREGSGRDAVYRPGQQGLAGLGAYVERTRLAYSQDAAGRGWDGRWHLVAFAIPEARRAGRDALRDHLIAIGGAAVQGGLYVSPHAWEKDVRAVAERLGIADAVTLASTDDLDIGGERDARELVRTLWPIDTLARRYEGFIHQFKAVLELLEDMRKRHQRLADDQFLPGAFAMAISYMDCFDSDPLLPPELLPRPWPGRTARDLAIRARRLALGLRQGPRPALFHLFDEALEAIS
ncbi:MAG: phenylacetic acid degradation operon negative regulatory protein [Actinomycetota bacterium]